MIRCLGKVQCGSSSTSSKGFDTKTTSRLHSRRHRQSKIFESPKKVQDAYVQISKDFELNCPHFRDCSGCTLSSKLFDVPTAHRAKRFFRQLGYDGDFLMHEPPSIHCWRHRARLAVRRSPTSGQSLVGLFRRNSHECVDIPKCVVHHPSLNAAADIVRTKIAECSIEPYDEETGLGQLRYVQLQVVHVSPEESSSGGEATEAQCMVQLVLVWNSSGLKNAGKELRAFAEAIWKSSAPKGLKTKGSSMSALPCFHSIFANFQPDRTNTIMGENSTLLYGEPQCWTTIAGAHICFGHDAFMQVNPAAMDIALQRMRRWVPVGARVADLHAGVGTISIALALTQNLVSLRLIEVCSSAESYFWKSWQVLQKNWRHVHLPSHVRKDDAVSLPSDENVEFIVAAAGSDPQKYLRDVDVAVFDPPRKGLEPSLLRFLCGDSNYPLQPTGVAEGCLPDRLIYLSCGWKAFERDCNSLLQSDLWKLRTAEGFLFFPGADHIETLAVFDRLKDTD